MKNYCIMRFSHREQAELLANALMRTTGEGFGAKKAGEDCWKVEYDTPTVKILVGDTFPAHLFGRTAVVAPTKPEHVPEYLKRYPWASFWGDESTAAWASELSGVNLTPKSGNPEVSLNADGFPVMDGAVYNTVLVLSADRCLLITF